MIIENYANIYISEATNLFIDSDDLRGADWRDNEADDRDFIDDKNGVMLIGKEQGSVYSERDIADTESGLADLERDSVYIGRDIADSERDLAGLERGFVCLGRDLAYFEGDFSYRESDFSDIGQGFADSGRDLTDKKYIKKGEGVNRFRVIEKRKD